MKVFLSWSGALSLKIACAFRDWFPSVIQSLKPYVSSEDIDKGTRWSTDIAIELEQSSFGIICITKDNVEAPWVNFEAGALSKTFDKSKVCPFLFNVKRAELQGPLLQFQSVIYEKDDIEKLVASLNDSLPEEERLEDARLKKVFEVWWPELKQQLDNLKKKEPTEGEEKATTPKESPNAILEELLELARSQQKLLRSPVEFLPPRYIEEILIPYVTASRKEDPELVNAIYRLSSVYENLVEFADSLKDHKVLDVDVSEVDELFERIHSIDNIIRSLIRGLPPHRLSARGLREPSRPLFRK